MTLLLSLWDSSGHALQPIRVKSWDDVDARVAMLAKVGVEVVEVIEVPQGPRLPPPAPATREHARAMARRIEEQLEPA